MAWGGGGMGILDVICLATWDIMAECGGLVQTRHLVRVVGGGS